MSLLVADSPAVMDAMFSFFDIPTAFIHSSCVFQSDTAKSILNIITVGIIEKSPSSINPLCNDMVQRSRGIYTDLLKHGHPGI